MSMELAHIESLPGHLETPALFGQDFPGFTALFDYWQSIRRGRIVPRSADFDLLALTNWLPDMSLLDVLNAEDVIWRFAGTTIVERMGHDPSGQNVFNIQAPAMKSRTARAYQIATRQEQPCGAVARYTNHYSSGREGNVRSLYLPLETPAGNYSRLVAVTFREDATSFAEPIERTMTGTKILSIDWIDLGLGVPSQDN
jgi:hypothetical protein